MSYRNDFLEAFVRSSRILPQDEIKRVEYEDLSGFPVEEAGIGCQDFAGFIERFFCGYLKTMGRPTAKCHVISHDALFRAVMLKEYTEEEISLTIGDVAFDGKWLYNVDEESITKIIKAGPQVDKTLDCHVWLTYRSNHVFDMSILFNLESRGLWRIGPSQWPVVYWNDQGEKAKWRLRYKPIIVDNNFLYRVDDVANPGLKHLKLMWLGR